MEAVWDLKSLQPVIVPDRAANGGIRLIPEAPPRHWKSVSGGRRGVADCEAVTA
jgi:hypothetical protein